jgi:dynein heavy chain
MNFKKFKSKSIFILKTVEGFLAEYNVSSKVPMDLVIFEFLVDHILKISRMLKQTNGHGLLIGMEGMGRSSATKLAAFVSNIEFFQIEAGQNYTIVDWRADLKFLLRKTGEKGIKTVFLFSDHQIKDEEFLENINMLLNCAELPILFESEEKTEIIDKIQQLSKNENTQEDNTPHFLYTKFIERVRSNLHIILAFSPIGDNFRNQTRMFPSMINCCTIDWFDVKENPT